MVLCGVSAIRLQQKRQCMELLRCAIGVSSSVCWTIACTCLCVYSPRQEHDLGLPQLTNAQFSFVAVIDYDAVRADMKLVFAEKINEVRSAISRLQKAQRAAEQALDKFAVRMG